MAAPEGNNYASLRQTSGPKPWGLRKMLHDNVERLTPQYFAVLKESLEMDDKLDKRWAASEMTKLVSKYIPTTLEGDGEDGAIKITIAKDIADKNLLDVTDSSTISNS